MDNAERGSRHNPAETEEEAIDHLRVGRKEVNITKEVFDAFDWRDHLDHARADEDGRIWIVWRGQKEELVDGDWKAVEWWLRMCPAGQMEAREICLLAWAGRGEIRVKKLPGSIDKDGKYYAVFEEWLYPGASGRDFEGDYDTKEEALERCRELCHEELGNYSKHTDSLPPEMFADQNGEVRGYCVTAKNGLDDWWYTAKVVEVNYGN